MPHHHCSQHHRSSSLLIHQSLIHYNSSHRWIYIIFSRYSLIWKSYHPHLMFDHKAVDVSGVEVQLWLCSDKWYYDYVLFKHCTIVSVIIIIISDIIISWLGKSWVCLSEWCICMMRVMILNDDDNRVNRWHRLQLPLSTPPSYHRSTTLIYLYLYHHYYYYSSW